MENDYIIGDTDIKRLIVKALEARERHMPGIHSLRSEQHSWQVVRIIRMKRNVLAENRTTTIKTRTDTGYLQAVI
ncbi:hypothetical protein [Coprococcus sp. OM06-25]|uniref:hypothetical protein n=1 Tax=Coprococcus sp. OM06-25 TaxID=2293094 RepID=UPI002E8DD697